MKISKHTVRNIPEHSGVTVPAGELFSLPEKVLQFGTGVLLRGLPDYFIDKANKHGIFNGRIVVVKSTAGGVDAFDEQDGLYTVCVRGIQGMSKVEENILISSISRVVSAMENWDEILKCAANPDIQLVISNTTEVGITLIQDDIHASPPESFPGKLLSFLYRRYQVFNGNKEKGMVIIPTELIIDNGNRLREILLELSLQNGLESAFTDWLTQHNYFCNSLVDRIVPGRLPEAEHKRMERALGYQDELMIMSEVYRLWAIESSEQKVYDILSFKMADDGVVIAKDINTFRELKLRLLNGSHTFSCALAYLCGFTTVKEAMDNKYFASYITNLMIEEIVPAIASDQITMEMAKDFANKVIDRYRNPHIEHLWLSISMQYSAKMRMRNIHTLKKYYQRFGTVPANMALGFAAFLLFLKTKKMEDGKFKGQANNKMYPVTDDNAILFAEKWQHADTDTVVQNILRDDKLWESDLSSLPGFSEAVRDMMYSLTEHGALTSLKGMASSKAFEQS